MNLTARQLSEVLVDGASITSLTPTQVMQIHQSLTADSITSPERSQLFQESKLWSLGEPSVDVNSTTDALAKWRAVEHPPTRTMADALHAQAFPKAPSMGSRRKRKKKKSTRRKSTLPWSIRQPKGDLMRGLDGLTEAEAMQAWKESMGPQSFRLSKAKAAILLYQKCVAEQDDIQASILGDYELERYEHAQTQKKLFAQETLFADLLKRCARMEAESRGASTEHVDSQVYARLLQAAASSTTLNGVMDSARAVSDDILNDVQRALDLKKQRLDDLEEDMRAVNRELRDTVARNNDLRLKLQRMTSEGQRLNDKNGQLHATESSLVQRSMASERITAAEKRRRIKAEDVLAAQSGEVATFVHSVLDACKRHFGYVPPGVKSVSVFFAPNVVQIPFQTKSNSSSSIPLALE
jgi:hypothetical protein